MLKKTILHTLLLYKSLGSSVRCIWSLFYITCFLFLGELKAQTIITVAGNGVQGYSGDGGFAINAQLYAPSGIAVDAMGNVYIADEGNSRVRKINTNDSINTFAGTGIIGYSGDGGFATNALLYKPIGVATDILNNVYIADIDTNVIRKVNTNGIISTFAGTGVQGHTGNGGLATNAELSSPVGVTVDFSGNAYIADGTFNFIRKINTNGVINDIAGNGTAGFNGDGILATNAELRAPTRVAIDTKGNLYIADYFNNRIRKINTNGIINTVAGNGTSGSLGDGGLATNAELARPYDIAIDAADNLYIADSYNNKIRRIDTSGIINTVVGTGIQGYTGDNGSAAGAELNDPIGIAIDVNGNLYIADRGNNVIRKVTGVASGINNLSANNYLFVYPNPCSTILNIEWGEKNEMGEITLTNIIGEEITDRKLKTKTNTQQVDVSNIPNGVYLLNLLVKDKSVTKKIIVNH